MVPVVSWWILIEILGLAALPIAYRCLRWLPEHGYVFSKTLGLLLASYLLWFGASTGFLRNQTGSILFVIVALFAISGYVLFQGKHLPDFVSYLRQSKILILAVELLFTTAFVGWAILRAYAPDKVMSAGGEKFMEMAFLNGVLNSPRFPPLDPWLSGYSISYYYFGYVMMALLTRLTGVSAGVGFELYDALLFALSISGVFGIVYNLVYTGRRNSVHTGETRHPMFQGIRYGFFGSLLVVLLGNLEGLLESLYTRGLLPESFWRWVDIPGLLGSPVTGSWSPGGGFFGCCWRASRILQDYDLAGQPMGVSPITEFPLFSFLLGDNHPHVLALPFVLLLIALSYNLLLYRQQITVTEPLDSRRGFWPDASLVPLRDWALLVFYAFCLGALGFLNTWDMPIYLGLLVLAYGLGEYTRQGKLDWGLALRTILLAGLLLAGAILFYSFFYLGFSSQAGGILPYVFKPTRLAQYLVMFGVYIYLISWFQILSAKGRARENGRRFVARSIIQAWGWIILLSAGLVLVFAAVLGLAIGMGQLQNPIVQNVLGDANLTQMIGNFLSARLSNPWLYGLLTGIMALSLALLRSNRSAEKAENEPSQQFVFLLILVGITLTFSVELFYLRDSFGLRMNTVFKFYYQAWIMLGCASAYAIWWVLNPGRSILGVIGRGVFLAGAALLIGGGMIYTLIATDARVGGFRGTPNLDGTANLARDNPDDWAAIEWLRSQAARLSKSHGGESSFVILEAPGKSYNYEGRISAFSGYPALLGWALHEAQWRGNYDEQGLREPDIQTIYSTKSANLALDLLHKWKIKYVILGPSELNYIQQLCMNESLACSLPRALQKFETILIPVFQQGNITIYEVPEKAAP